MFELDISVLTSAFTVLYVAFSPGSRDESDKEGGAQFTAYILLLPRELGNEAICCT